MGLKYNYALIERQAAERQASDIRQRAEATNASLDEVQSFIDANAKASRFNQMDEMIENHRRAGS